MSYADRLVLGTVQLGIRYGLAKKVPEERDAFAILDRAWDLGIRRFDCAASYGLAEERLGRWVRAKGVADKTEIATKIPSLGGQNEKEINVGFVLTLIKESLSRMQLSYVQACLLHACDDLLNADVQEAFEAARDAGLIVQFGASCYVPDEVARLRSVSPQSNYYQLPSSVFDTRFQKVQDDLLSQTNDSFTIVLRSAMLQGLAVLPIADLPPFASELAGPITVLRNTAVEIGISPAALCLCYVLQRCPAAYIVFGVLTDEQLDAAAEVIKTGPIDSEILDRLESQIGPIRQTLTDPRTWPKN